MPTGGLFLLSFYFCTAQCGGLWLAIRHSHTINLGLVWTLARGCVMNTRALMMCSEGEGYPAVAVLSAVLKGKGGGLT